MEQHVSADVYKINLSWLVLLRCLALLRLLHHNDIYENCLHRDIELKAILFQGKAGGSNGQ